MNKFYLSVLLLFIFSGASAQTTVNLSATADNTIYDDFSTNSNGAGPNFTAGTNSGLGIRRALIRFNIAASGIPTGAIITAVTLKLNLNKTKSNTDLVSLYKLNSNWGEGTSNAGDPDGQGATATTNDATWFCRFSDGAGGCTSSWVTAGGDFNGSASATTSIPPTLGIYNWSSAQMIADVQSWLNTPSTDFGWIIRSDESYIRSANRFDSRQGAVPPVLTITYNNPVPVKLTSFTGQAANNGNYLSWSTAQEFNNDFFSIEHSFNAADYTSVGKVQGYGTSSLPHTYQFTHTGIGAGRHYYRLAQNDKDGKVVYSQVISISNTRKNYTLTISPNPVVATVRVKARPGTLFTITNIAGGIVLSGTLLQGNISVNTLPAGVYYIKLVQPENEILLMGKFMKN